MNPDISIIIPTRNEADHLRETLLSLVDNSASVEILIVDAASEDGSAEIPASFDQARVLHSPRPCRSAQMNQGAIEARAPVLLFLHADTRLPSGSLDRILTALRADPSLSGGAFCRRFSPSPPLLVITAWLSDLRSRHLGLFLGDQAIFVRREIFAELDGFDETLALCEDLDLSRRLKSRGATLALTPPAVSSARRFEARGPLRTTLSDLGHAIRYFRSRGCVKIQI